MGRYLRSTDRADVADAADKVAEHLTGDAEVYANPESILIRLSKLIFQLEPHLNGPFTPDGYANF
jgi:aconitate hydratase